MEILVLNLGSSSIKFKLFDMKENKPLASGLAEKIGEEIGQLKIKSHLHHNDQELKEKLVIKDHASGLLMIRENLTKMGIIKDFNQIDAIGHRVVQGGDKFHATMPNYAYMYALPYELYEKYQIRRYGFHGTSHHYVAKEAAKFLNTAYEEFNAISLHLGNGSSAAAIQKGKSVDTSMGLTPLEGLIMGTRCGDIDPTVVEYIAQCANKSLEEVMKILNHESGLKGICGDNDARNIEARKEKGDKQAKLAFEMCAYRIKKHIGAYMVALGRVDAIIFTGGLGENYSALRESVCEGLEDLGIALHKPTNDNPGNGLVDLSQPDSKVKVLRIPTDEELEIALQAKEIVEKLK
ncbi:acetate kinase [Helicobacter pylori]|uniref:acetate kinase n=1 Tax=Helicobacter pylori TaxID=210 RepID=UPI00042E832F|nr:acetate kinase [Helicobacter pylori]AHN45032.1 acetate kinase [Helicobacter pylori oki898]